MKNKILLGITGGIAAYKSVEIARQFIKKNIDIYTVMTKNAAKFIKPLTMEVITGNKTALDLFQRDLPSNIPHIDLARETNLILVAPATANIIGKVAAGIADDLLTTLIMATTSPVVFAPAMNKEMYNNPIVQRNINLLKELNYHFIEPEAGELACREEGKGRLVDINIIVSYVINILENKYEK